MPPQPRWFASHKSLVNGFMCVQEELRGPRVPMVRKQSGRKGGRHFKGRGKEDWQLWTQSSKEDYATGCPVFIKLSKVQSMQCIVKLPSIFCFDTIKQSREVNTVKLTVYICFLKLPVSLFALLIYIQVVPFSPHSFLSLYYYFFN